MAVELKNELLMFGMLNLLIVRLIGFLFILEYYNRLLVKRLYHLLLGLFLFVLAPVVMLLNIFIDFGNAANLLTLVYLVLTTLSSLYIGLTLELYYSTTKKTSSYIKLFKNTATAWIIFFNLILYCLVGMHEIISKLHALTQTVFLLFFLGSGIRHRKKIQNLSKNSFRWFSVLVIFLFGLFTYYIFNVNSVFSVIELILYSAVSLSIILFFVTLEDGILIQQRNKLKDKYSHELAQLLQKQFLYQGILQKTNDQKEQELILLQIPRINQAILDLLSLIRKL